MRRSRSSEEQIIGLLKEPVPVGHPVSFDALPDIDSFYREWLGRSLPDEKEFKDMSYEVTRMWGK